MADVYCIVNRTASLSDRTQKININEPLAYDNALAHAMRFTAVSDDGPENLSGVSCFGSFTPVGKNTITPIPGDIIGDGFNVAQVILPGACYENPGRFKFTMNLTKEDGTSRTVLWVEGHIERNQTATIEAPTEVINVTQVISEASEAAGDARQAALAASAFTSAIAPTFEDIMATSPFQPIEAYIQHCWHEGTLYVNTVDIDSTEQWNAEHWEVCDISGELAWRVMKGENSPDIADKDDVLPYVQGTLETNSSGGD